MAAPNDPKSVLAALLADEALPFDAAPREAAQNLARAPGSARPEAVERPARPAAAAPAPTSAPEEEAPPALLSAVTGNGERAMILARPIRGGLETAHLVLNDEKGVVHLALREASRGLYRKQLKEVRQGRTPPAIELPLEEAKDRLAAAVHLNERSGTPRPDGLTELLRHLDVAPREAAV